MLFGAFGVLEMCDMQIPTNDCEIAVLKTDFDNIIKMLKGACENLRYSPVSYLLGYLIDYFEGKDSAKKFCDSVFMDTRRGQYYLSRMPESEMRANLRVFGREFTMADEINDAIKAFLATDMSENANVILKGSVFACVKRYFTENISRIKV